jgi:hypothetical protein
MSLNGIAHLANKQLKQVAKLALAESDRDRVGNPRSAYDITQLPTQYSTNSIVDNPNAGGLLQGRPWVALTNGGVYQYSYSGYWNEVPNFFTTNTSTSNKVASNFTIASEPTAKSEWLLGYIKPNYTGTWTFSMYSDDYGLLWIGTNAIAGYTTTNALIVANVNTVTATINLVADSYYPIMIMYGNNSGPGSLQLQYSHTGQSLTDVPSSMLFYNPVTNGI